MIIYKCKRSQKTWLQDELSMTFLVVQTVHYRPLIMSQKVTSNSIIIDKDGCYLVVTLVLPATVVLL